MKVLVTGAAGFIGGNLVRYLAEVRPQWSIVALDKLTYAGNFENVADLVAAKKIAFERLDIVDAAAMKTLFEREQFELVFHLAAESHVDRSIFSGVEFARTNVVGTQVLLDAARAAKVRRFVHVSTDEVYGSLGPTGRFVETTPLDPSSAYSSSKAGSDLMALAAWKTHHQETLVTRCTNNYGPYQFPEKLIPLFITNALDDKELPLYGDGLNVRSWVYVIDHCEGLLMVAERGRPGEVYNIGGAAEAELANRDVTRKILARLNKPETLIRPVADRLGHDRRYAIDYAKINKELGWKPRIDFDRGIDLTIAWYKSNEAWWRKIKSGEYLSFYEQNYGTRGKA